MRYLTVLAALLFIAAGSSFAQQSVGFSNPDNIDPLLDYRLPDWGYSNFYLDFDAQGRGKDVKGTNSEFVTSMSDLSIRPGYRLFRESEGRTFKLNSSMSLGYQGRSLRSNSSFSNNESKDKERDFNFGLDISTTIREYITDQSFLFGDGNINVTYNSNNSEDFQDGTLSNKVVSYNRRFSATPRIGYGLGRIRNVNPIIRAVRLSERASALGDGIDFTNQDILEAADQFTQYDGYRQTYDRPEKYFWGDMDEATSPNLGSLDAFDMMYLTDVLDEAVGNRLEGWEVVGGAEFNYGNSLERTEESGMVNRYEFIRKRAGIFVDGRWYKNISLTQQWGVTGNATLSYPLEDGDPNTIEEKRSLRLQAGVNYLWNISDRFLLGSGLYNIYSRSKFEGFSIGGGDGFSQWTNRLVLNNNFSYYLENGLFLTLSLYSSLTHDGDTQSDVTLDNRRFDWSASLGLRYYFSRNLY